MKWVGSGAKGPKIRDAASQSSSASWPDVKHLWTYTMRGPGRAWNHWEIEVLTEFRYRKFLENEFHRYNFGAQVGRILEASTWWKLYVRGKNNLLLLTMLWRNSAGRLLKQKKTGAGLFWLACDIL
jgi:hypothetical protein